VKTADALNLLIALEERVARIYFRFFRLFRADPVAAQCWWDLARDEYGHSGLLTMIRELVAPGADCGEIGTRLWSLVETVEHCEQEARNADSLGRALELAIRLESSELDALGHRIVESLEADLPPGAGRTFSTLGAHHGRLMQAADRITDRKLRQRLESMLGSIQEP
jgi:hypothetical protein